MMRWINEYKTFWRLAILFLLLIVFIGPWGFDRISVPTQYDCAYRLEGVLCGIPISGVSAFATNFGHILNGFENIGGSMDPRHLIIRNLWVIYFALIPLPVFSTCLLFLPGKPSARQKFHFMAWTFVFAGGIGILLWFRSFFMFKAWGFVSYLLLGGIALWFEGTLLFRKHSHNSSHDNSMSLRLE